MTAADAASSQIAEDPSTAVVNGEAAVVWLGPVTILDIDAGANTRSRSMVSVTDRPPEGAVGIGGEAWTITGQEGQGGGVFISELVSE
jgi:hypothetical protein